MILIKFYFALRITYVICVICFVIATVVICVIHVINTICRQYLSWQNNLTKLTMHQPTKIEPLCMECISCWNSTTHALAALWYHQLKHQLSQQILATYYIYYLHYIYCMYYKCYIHDIYTHIIHHVHMDLSIVWWHKSELWCYQVYVSIVCINITKQLVYASFLLL